MIKEKISSSLSIIGAETRFIEDVVTSEADLRSQESQRLRNYVEFWKLYRGEHWDETELDADKPTPVLNKTFVVVNKGIAFLVGKPPTINYPSEKVEALLAPYVEILLDNSGGMGQLSFDAA